MKYQQKSFSLPAGPSTVSQEEWDRIFSPKEDKPRKRITKRQKKSTTTDESTCCGHEGCGWDCGCICN